MQRTGFLDYQLLSAAPTEFILLSDQHLYGKFPLFRHAELQQREERGRICASGRIYDHYFPPPFQKPLWCARIRMDTGKKREGILEDLQHTKMRITEICNRYGFDSLSHFAHFCKDSFGDTPRALRKKAAGGEKIGKVQ